MHYQHNPYDPHAFIGQQPLVRVDEHLYAGLPQDTLYVVMCWGENEPSSILVGGDVDTGVQLTVQHRAFHTLADYKRGIRSANTHHVRALPTTIDTYLKILSKQIENGLQPYLEVREIAADSGQYEIIREKGTIYINQYQSRLCRNDPEAYIKASQMLWTLRNLTMLGDGVVHPQTIWYTKEDDDTTYATPDSLCGVNITEVVHTSEGVWLHCDNTPHTFFIKGGRYNVTLPRRVRHARIDPHHREIVLDDIYTNGTEVIVKFWGMLSPK